MPRNQAKPRAAARSSKPVNSCVRLELTLRTPMALTAIERIAGEVPEIFLGAGTIVEPSQAKQAASAGAQFLVSPGSTPTLPQAMTDSGLPHLPGVATVSEILRTHIDHDDGNDGDTVEQ